MKLAVLIAFVTLGLAAAIGGAAPFGRVLMAAGAPGLAAVVFQRPDWRGVAAYRAGNFDRAATEFEAAGAWYNLGNAEVHRGRYAAALEAYDVAVARTGDASARTNFDLVAAFYSGFAVDPEALGLFPKRKEGPKEDSFIARGDARAAGTGSEVTNANTMLGLAELDSRGRLGVRRIFDDAFMVADERWLEQLEDVPGAFMSARITAEYKRRQKLGLTPPPPEDPQ